MIYYVRFKLFKFQKHFIISSPFAPDDQMPTIKVFSGAFSGINQIEQYLWTYSTVYSQTNIQDVLKPV